MEFNQAEAKKAWQNKVSNAQGHIFEDEILRACAIYKEKGLANIDKTPEPYRVMKKEQRNGKYNGMFTGRFLEPAQPDFQGTLKNGRSIVFEAKSTTTDRVQAGRLTQTQTDTLESHYQLNALVFVCLQIQSEFFAVPWYIWRRMKEIYGHKFLTAADIAEYKIPYRMAVMFLENKNLFLHKEG